MKQRSQDSDPDQGEAFGTPVIFVSARSIPAAIYAAMREVLARGRRMRTGVRPEGSRGKLPRPTQPGCQLGDRDPRSLRATKVPEVQLRRDRQVHRGNVLGRQRPPRSRPGVLEGAPRRRGIRRDQGHPLALHLSSAALRLPDIRWAGHRPGREDAGATG